MNEKSGGGLSFLGILAILLIAFKLLGVINWSWIWVLAPIWAPMIIAMFIVAMFFD